MIKLILKTAGLLLVIAFSNPGMAQSPWAVKKTVVDEPEEATTQSAPDATNTGAVENVDTGSGNTGSDNIETIDQQNSSPAAMEADNGMSTVDGSMPPQQQPAAATVTEQHGDVLNQTNQNLSNTVRIIDFPKRGMSTSKVQNELGQPAEILPAIGQPPITRWIYNDRTVYFEYSAVIHVVSN
ncbi:hypothetical protein MNBD_GAMMA09-2973 [hydrothermal vent metagenome]|uniref:Uncharacterized protein n=1 Tax=hydrothermal vent metagenome TaxID=652676 RepID=A0A3B0XCK5_9ZZZZ